MWKLKSKQIRERAESEQSEKISRQKTNKKAKAIREEKRSEATEKREQQSSRVVKQLCVVHGMRCDVMGEREW